MIETNPLMKLKDIESNTNNAIVEVEQHKPAASQDILGNRTSLLPFWQLSLLLF